MYFVVRCNTHEEATTVWTKTVTILDPQFRDYAFDVAAEKQAEVDPQEMVWFEVRDDRGRPLRDPRQDDIEFDCPF